MTRFQSQVDGESELTNANRHNRPEARIDPAAKATEPLAHQAGPQMQPRQPPFQAVLKETTTFSVVNNQMLANTIPLSMEVCMVVKSQVDTMAPLVGIVIK